MVTRDCQAPKMTKLLIFFSHKAFVLLQKTLNIANKSHEYHTSAFRSIKTHGFCMKKNLNKHSSISSFVFQGRYWQLQTDIKVNRWWQNLHICVKPENAFGKYCSSSHVQVKSHLEIDVEINEDLILPAVSLPLERIGWWHRQLVRNILAGYYCFHLRLQKASWDQNQNYKHFSHASVSFNFVHTSRQLSAKYQYNK